MRRCTKCNSFFEDNVEHCPYDSAPTVEVDSPPGAEPSLKGKIISDRYEVGEQIGAGGMGIVHRATDRRTGETIAIKILHQSISGDPRTVKRFFSEARVLSSLSHPNIIRFTDFGRTDDGQLFIAMELLTGTPLDLLLETESVSLKDAIDIIDQTAAALGEAHLQGVIHRDLKPANLFAKRGSNGDLKVTVLDFGIAKVTGGQNLTATGKVMGTPSYMAPEQIRGAAPDPGTDIYALGAMGYELIAGQPPFIAENAVAVMFMHLEQEVPPLLGLDLDEPVSRELSQAIDKLLAKDPGNRPRNMVEVRTLLSQFTGYLAPDDALDIKDTIDTQIPHSALARATAAAKSTDSLPAIPAMKARRQAVHDVEELRNPWTWWVGAVVVALLLAGIVAGGILWVAKNTILSPTKQPPSTESIAR